MDATNESFAYRCLPLTIANSMGWELLLPARVAAKWNGGPALTDLEVEVDDGEWGDQRLASSHFGSGILTFQTNYLFQTDPGIGLWVRGAPNEPKDGIAPLDGIVETDWLPFTFTMNWAFTRPGRIVFEAGETFCFLTPISYRALEAVTPEIRPLAATPELAAQYAAWAEGRREFNTRLAADEPAAAAQRWQKWYTRGETALGGRAPERHLTKLRLADPVRAPSPAEDTIGIPKPRPPKS
jgi:hypothetical protein